MSKLTYILVFISVAGMSAAQLLLKKGLLSIGQWPQNFSEIIKFFLKVFSNPYVISAVIMTLLTASAWILALSKAELSNAYPFMALSYVLVAVFSLLFFKEDITVLRWFGILVICLGVFLVSRS
jgi:drug/metabolite transporter (DMT)-like permease